MSQTARRAGRDARRAKRSAPKFDMLPTLVRKLPLCEPMDEDQVRLIDDASMAILEEVGVIFRDPVALEDWKAAGARVEGERVYFDRAQIRELISTIPATITYHARDPQKSVVIGGNQSIFVPMTGAPYLRDLEDKRRWPTLILPKTASNGLHRSRCRPGSLSCLLPGGERAPIYRYGSDQRKSLSTVSSVNDSRNAIRSWRSDSDSSNPRINSDL